MDIKVLRDPEKIEIILKNYDVPYNPLILAERESEADSCSKIGVVMVQRMADKLLYSYAYQFNVITITLPAV